MKRLIFSACSAIVIAGLANLVAVRQNECETPLGEGDFRQLISAGVPPVRIRQLIVSCGIDFGAPDIAALETRVRQLGAPTMVVAALFPPDSPAAGATWTSPIDRRKMTFVPAGQFQMGSSAEEMGRDEDEASHQLKVDIGFWVDTAEVTNAAYRQFVLSRPEWQKGLVRSEFADSGYLKSWDGNAFPKGADNDPVTFVSWHAARAYAAWAGKRLPSEAEWEYAARGGTSTIYWWGDTFDSKHIRQRDDRSDDGEKRRSNSWGLIDVTGGVWEWTASLFQPYPFSSDGRDDPRAPGKRSLRGGASANGAQFLRLANRNSAEPNATSESVGLRCVE